MKISEELQFSSVSEEEYQMRQTITELLPKIKRLERLEEIVDEEMAKPDEESDLCIIGEKVVGYLGYWG